MTENPAYAAMTDYHGSNDYPCAPDAQHQEGAIQMTENPAYAASSDYIMYY